jgi:hypothetical protein
MDTRKKLAALLGAGALVLGLAGVAFAGTGASTQGVDPVSYDGNITNSGTYAQTYCDAADGIDTSDATSGDYQSANGVTVSVTFDGNTNTVSFTASGGLVTAAFIKGSDAYNEYDYIAALGHGVDSDGNLYAPGGMSHAVFCTGPSSEESQPPTEEPSFNNTGEPATDVPSEPNTATIGGAGTSGPSDSSWLLVAGLGVLLASVVVMTPARAKTRR